MKIIHLNELNFINNGHFIDNFTLAHKIIKTISINYIERFDILINAWGIFGELNKLRVY